MAEAFTAGVKMGGLTSDTEIRLLLCYLVKTAGPVTRETLEGALLQEQLVNYFEFADALSELQRQGLICAGDKGFTVTPKSATVAWGLMTRQKASSEASTSAMPGRSRASTASYRAGTRSGVSSVTQWCSPCRNSFMRRINGASAPG